MQFKFLFFNFIALPLLPHFNWAEPGSKEVNDNCVIPINNHSPPIRGVCKTANDCPNLRSLMSDLGLTARDVIHCGFTIYEEIICCPHSYIQRGLTDENRSKFRQRVPSTRINERKAVKGCHHFSGDLVQPHILGGVEVNPGEFPHMAAIAYDLHGSYQFQCGGALISKRFVLTAAHCVNGVHTVPSFVRLGASTIQTSSGDALNQTEAIDVRIKRLHIHPHYTMREIYDDIALIELERDVAFNFLVHPICLYTSLADPPLNTVLTVTGWGVTDVKALTQSPHLQKTNVKISPLDVCNKTYEDFSHKMRYGLRNTQLCAIDEEQIRDACQGDSGGPLHIEDSQSHRKYLIGIVSTGAACSSYLPGIYTRAAAYLDFIEAIVWP